MKRIRAHKAQSIGDREVESLSISLSTPMPRRDTIAETAKLFEEDGARLATALCAVLPGGTLDALTAELLRHKATSLIVARRG